MKNGKPEISDLPILQKELRDVMAKDAADWLVSYTAAGFTREEAMQMLCKAQVNIAPAAPQ